MVASYLQITKTLLISLLYFGLLSFPKYEEQSVKTQEIDNYLKLVFSFSSDTVRIGDRVKLNVLFINKTDSAAQFYPKSVIYLTKPFVAFGIDNAIPINDTLDLRKTVKINPKETYIETWDILINKDFFVVGINQLTLYFRCNERKRKDKKSNLLYGSLKSNEFNLFVQSE